MYANIAGKRELKQKQKTGQYIVCAPGKPQNIGFESNFKSFRIREKTPR